MSENGKSKKVAALVVGVDGSAGAAEALRWAVAEARLRKVPLRVVQPGHSVTRACRSKGLPTWVPSVPTPRRVLTPLSYSGWQKTC